MRHRLAAAIGTGLAAAVAATGIATAGPPGSGGGTRDSTRPGGSTADSPIAVTGNGPVRGTLSTDNRTFLGIPYARPPVGELRWAAPRPATGWTGVRDTTRHGNDCPQTAGFLGDKASDTEDCLYLNVTTPRRTGSRQLPVLVFIHGGGFYSGSAALYNAEQLAAKGDVVVVTPNYRLGVFGFLAHPALGGQSGDFGLADQQEALRWVHRNAGAFGGDPGNVTLFGESAGSVSTCSHLAAPSSAGLFQRAIMDSGPCTVTTQWPYQDGNWYPRPRDVAQRAGTAVATKLGCAEAATAASCLRGKPVSALLAASDGGQGFGPAYGGDSLLPVSPLRALATGRFNKVPVMHGTTRDEHRTFVGAIEQFTGQVTTAEDYRTQVAQFFGADRAATVLARYPVAAYGSPSLALAAVWTDYSWACPARQTEQLFSGQVPTYAFEFADENAPWASSISAPAFPTGAFHAGELQYLFDDEQFPGPATGAQRQLSDQMIRYWTRFAHTGDPNGPDTPAWPQLPASGRYVQSLAPDAAGIHPVDLGREHQCGFWQSLDQ